MTHISSNGNGDNGGSADRQPASRYQNGARHPLHRLGLVRRQEGISRRTVAQQLGVTMSEVQRQELGQTDLSLTLLHKWQRVLNVPLADLLVQPGDFLSPPVLRKAQLIQLTKMAMTIAERSTDEPIRRLARRMVAQLVDIMPELGEVRPMPAGGQLRGPEECGRAAEQTLPDQITG
jgi:transcriptional regulator with XRE-family HTH domain